MLVPLRPLRAYGLVALLVSVAAQSSTTTSATSTLTGLAASAPTVGPSRDVGRLPALGWNSWNAYGCNINETKILDTANQFVSLGLANAGYEYVNIDTCWSLSARDNDTGRIVPDPTEFPSGISSVADQVHSLGLKFGLYGSAGTSYSGFPGSLGNEELDMTTFAEWGVDYFKAVYGSIPSNWTDSANPPGGDWYNSNTAIRYRQMGAAMNKTDRPFLFSISTGGAVNDWEWGARVGHSWRMFSDLSPSWDSLMSAISFNVQHLDSIDFFSHNDMDMMQLGNGDLTIQEQRTHFAAWAFLKSPILLSTDLALLNSTQLDIIKSKELLAFHQDPTIGGPAVPFTPDEGAPTTSPPEFYTGNSSQGTHVFVINTGPAATKTFYFANVPGLESERWYSVRDMWTGGDLGTFMNGYESTVDTHDTAAFLVSPSDCQ